MEAPPYRHSTYSCTLVVWLPFIAYRLLRMARLITNPEAPKLPCQRCKKLILPMTASRTGGFCMRCVSHAHQPIFTERPRGIGYWQYLDEDSDSSHFPTPGTLVRDNWLSPESKLRLLHYLRSAPMYVGSSGQSFCRFALNSEYGTP